LTVAGVERMTAAVLAERPLAEPVNFLPGIPGAGPLVVTRAQIEAATDTVMAALQAGWTFERHHLLVTHTALSAQTLLTAHETYTAAQLGAFIANADRGVGLLAADDSSEARVYRVLALAVKQLASEALLVRDPEGTAH
jgi:hypothetical protein